MRQHYRALGYSDEWINARMQGIVVRDELTQEWRERGAKEGKQFAALTEILHSGTFDISTAEHKAVKQLGQRGELRDSMADRFGLPLAACAASASPHEVPLVAPTLDSRFIADVPLRLIGDRAYDADSLEVALAALDIEMIAPHRRGRVRPKTQDGRPLRRYRTRWKIERLFAWLGNFRRLVVRYERHALNYLGFVQLRCILILLRQGL